MKVLVERREIGDREKVPLLLLSPLERPVAPLVLFQHGYGGRKEDAVGALLALVERGFRVACMDARLHGARRVPDFAERFERDFAGEFLSVVDGTAGEVPVVLDALGAERAGFIGVSMGAFIAHWAIVREPRLVAVAALIGGPGFVGQIPGRPDIDARVREVGPLARLEQFPPTALLMINGALDEVVPPAGAMRLHEALRPHYSACPEHLRFSLDPNLGHTVTPEMWAESFAWIARHLRE